MSFLVKFRKSPHWTEKSLRHALKTRKSPFRQPLWTGKYVSYAWEGPPYGNPPLKGRKMAPERPFPILIETGKSHSKTGLLPAVFRRFCRQFPGGFPTVLPTVFRPFSAGFPAAQQRFCQWSPAVFQRFCRRFSSGSTPVFQRFDAGFPAVRRRFSSGSTPGFQRFDAGFPMIFQRFSGKFDGGWTTVFRQHASPGSTPVRLRPPPSSERNCRAIPYTLSSLQTQHMGRGKFPPVHGVPGRSAAGRNPTPLVEVLGGRIAVQDASGGISLGTSPTGHSGQRDADFA